MRVRPCLLFRSAARKENVSADARRRAPWNAFVDWEDDTRRTKSAYKKCDRGRRRRGVRGGSFKMGTRNGARKYAEKVLKACEIFQERREGRV